jgi:hypothetical protein
MFPGGAVDRENYSTGSGSSLNIFGASWYFSVTESDDGGETWEVNWIATDTRIKD